MIRGKLFFSRIGSSFILQRDSLVSAAPGIAEKELWVWTLPDTVTSLHFTLTYRT